MTSPALTSTPHERLQHALKRWNTNTPEQQIRSLRSVRVSQSASSCAAFTLRLSDEVGTKAGEIIRVLGLVARAGTASLDPIREMTRSIALSPGCPLSRWCAFCGGVDRTIQLRVVLCTSAKALTDAFFGRDELDVTAELGNLQEIVRKIEATHSSAKRQSLLEITLEINGRYLRDTDKRRALGNFLKQYSDAVALGERLLARITSVKVNKLDDETSAMVVESGCPIVHNNSWDDWRWAIQQPVGRPCDNAWVPKSTLLALGNVVELCVKVNRDDADDLLKLFEVLRSQPTRIKTLSIGYCEAFFNKSVSAQLNGAMVDALFSRSSALRLDRLCVQGDVIAAAMKTIHGRLNTETPSENLPYHRLRRLTCWGPSWSDTEDSKPGEMLAQLLQRIGGVDSLKIERFSVPWEGLAIEDIVSVASYRELEVSLNPESWKQLPSNDHDSSSSSRASLRIPQESRLERLLLRLSGEDNDVENSIDRLLQLVGGSLRSLTILPDTSWLVLRGNVADSIIRWCPHLESLDVESPHASFNTRLAACSRIACLSLNSVHPWNHALPLVQTLTKPTLPLTRSLRSLRLDGCGYRKGNARTAVYMAQSMLEANSRLRSVLFYCPLQSSIDSDEAAEMAEMARECGVSVALAPQRHRLAMLSALSPYNLPRGVMETVMEMAAHGVARLQLMYPGSDDDVDDEE